MSRAAELRLRIESDLQHRIPSALTPQANSLREVMPTGIPELDKLLNGGVPVGAVSEVVGPVCSGRTSIATSLLSSATAAGKLCAWVDASDAFSPEFASGAGVDLSRLLWVRCAGNTGMTGTHERDAQVQTKPVYPSASTERGRYLRKQGFGSTHPRNEIHGVPAAIEDLMRTQSSLGQVATGNPKKTSEKVTSKMKYSSQPKRSYGGREEQIATDRLPARRGDTVLKKFRNQVSAQDLYRSEHSAARSSSFCDRKNVWAQISRALKVTDLLLQAGGFPLIILDLGDLPPEHALRIPLTTWFRYRAAADKAKSILILLSQKVCAKSSAAVVLELESVQELQGAPRIFNGLCIRATLLRERFPVDGNEGVTTGRESPRPETSAGWACKAVWCAEMSA